MSSSFRVLASSFCRLSSRSLSCAISHCFCFADSWPRRSLSCIFCFSSCSYACRASLSVCCFRSLPCQRRCLFCDSSRFLFIVAQFALVPVLSFSYLGEIDLPRLLAHLVWSGGSCVSWSVADDVIPDEIGTPTVCVSGGGAATFSEILATWRSEMDGVSGKLAPRYSGEIGWSVLGVCSLIWISPPSLFGLLLRLGVYSGRLSSARHPIVSSPDRLVFVPPPLIVVSFRFYPL